MVAPTLCWAKTKKRLHQGLGFLKSWPNYGLHQWPCYIICSGVQNLHLQIHNGGSLKQSEFFPFPCCQRKRTVTKSRFLSSREWERAGWTSVTPNWENNTCKPTFWYSSTSSVSIQIKANKALIRDMRSCRSGSFSGEWVYFSIFHFWLTRVTKHWGTSCIFHPKFSTVILHLNMAATVGSPPLRWTTVWFVQRERYRLRRPCNIPSLLIDIHFFVQTRETETRSRLGNSRPSN